MSELESENTNNFWENGVCVLYFKVDMGKKLLNQQNNDVSTEENTIKPRRDRKIRRYNVTKIDDTTNSGNYLESSARHEVPDEGHKATDISRYDNSGSEFDKETIITKYKKQKKNNNKEDIDHSINSKNFRLEDKNGLNKYVEYTNMTNEINKGKDLTKHQSKSNLSSEEIAIKKRKRAENKKYKGNDNDNNIKEEVEGVSSFDISSNATVNEEPDQAKKSKRKGKGNEETATTKRRRAEKQKHKENIIDKNANSNDGESESAGGFNISHNDTVNDDEEPDKAKKRKRNDKRNKKTAIKASWSTEKQKHKRSADSNTNPNDEELESAGSFDISHSSTVNKHEEPDKIMSTKRKDKGNKESRRAEGWKHKGNAIDNNPNSNDEELESAKSFDISHNVSVNEDEEPNEPNKRKRREKRNKETAIKKSRRAEKQKHKGNVIDSTTNSNDELDSETIFDISHDGTINEDEEPGKAQKHKNKSDLNEYLERAMRKAEEDTEKMLLENNHLRDLHIIIPWEVEPTHQIETAAGMRPTREENAKFKKYSIKTGIFTKKEDIMIRHNFEDFCKQHNLRHDPSPFLNFVYAGKSLLPFPERLKFLQYIGRGLEDRKLYTICDRFRLLHITVQKGKFTPQEDKIILGYIQKHRADKFKFSNLAKILNRRKEQIQKRYYAITQVEDFTKIPTIERIEALVAAMMEVLDVTTIEEMKVKEIEKHNWKAISVLMDDIPVYELKSFWRLSVKTRLFNHNININKVLQEVIENLHQRKVEDWKELHWQEIVKPYKHKHYTAAFLYAKFKDLRRVHVPEQYHDKPKICVRMLRNLYKEYPMVCKKVRSYEYIDGKISKVS